MALIMASQRCIEVHCFALATRVANQVLTRWKKVLMVALLPLVLVSMRWLLCVVCLMTPCKSWSCSDGFAVMGWIGETTEA